MSRFLQRLIAAAQNPGGSIHPVLGSVYSPTPRTGLPQDTLPVTAPEHGVESAPAALRTGGRRTGVDSADRHRPQGAAESRVALDSAQETESGRDEQDVERAAATGRARSPVPLVNPNTEARETALRHSFSDRGAPTAQAAGTEVAGRHAPNADHDAPDADHDAPTTDRDASTTRRDASTTRRDASITGHYSPLMPANVPGMALAGNIAPAASSVRSQPPEREADEIQIHIGRIEVTAAAPAPARAAATPPRQLPSLDEFLKRRPGRAG